MKATMFKIVETDINVTVRTVLVEVTACGVTEEVRDADGTRYTIVQSIGQTVFYTKNQAINAFIEKATSILVSRTSRVSAYITTIADLEARIESARALREVVE